METAKAWSLYLDFDGVLNNDRFLRHQKNHLPRQQHRLFDPENLAAADLLCAELPVDHITVTSSWRVGRSIPELRELLRSEAFQHAHLISSVTDSMDDRTEEIRTHVLQNNVQHVLILDDEPLHPYRKPTFFRTSPGRGLTRAFVGEILQALR